MTADNVEQLMEIVRALQQGEEPDPRKRKQEKKTEEPESGRPKRNRPEVTESGGTKRNRPEVTESGGTKRNRPEVTESGGQETDGEKAKEPERKKAAAGQKAKKSRREISGRLTDPDTDDEFERMLQEDDTEEEFERGKEAVAAAATKAAGFLDGLKQKRKQRQEEQARQKKQRQEEQARQKKQRQEEQAGQNEQYQEKQAKQNGQYQEEQAKQNEQYQAEQKEQHQEEQAKREVQQDRTGNVLRDEQDRIAFRRASTGTTAEDTVRKQEHNVTDSLKNLAEDGTDGADSLKNPPEDGTEVTDSLKNPPEDGADRIKKYQKDGTAAAKKNLAGVRDFMDGLGQRGIHSRELVMLGAVALFVILLVLIAVNVVRGSLDQKRKSKNVTADEGLVVMVEDEPDSWCSSYPVKLKMYVKGETIASASVNGKSYRPDEEGIITVDADDWLLDAEVRTESSTKRARIEIEYLDGDAPVLEIKKEEGQIMLTAVDARSSAAAIYYAVTEENDYNQLPYYQKYSDSIPYEEGTVYRFYSRDKAGNSSTPVVTTLQNAESFSLNRTEASLFPGETFGLGVIVEPEGALLENLKYESMDEQVLSVEQNGKVTAVGNGTAAVRVTANGLESQVCTVTVSNERTVTISAIGDCTLGTDEAFNTSTNFDAFYAVNGYSYFFQNVSSILGQDDVTFANFEGTLTDSTARENKEYAFKGDPSYTEILKSGSIEVVTLANNHSRDYGEESLKDTEAALTAAGIDYCNGDEIVIRDVNGIRTAFIGIYVLDVGMERESQVKETIARAQKQGAELIIVAFHWGSERQNYPDETQTSLAHTAIDCGADLVVGHHPHVLQGIEKYNGKYIVYSLANFCFGGNSAPSDMDTMIVQQTFTVSAAGVQDAGEIKIFPCKVSSVSGYNNYQPTPATGADAEQIMSRLNEYSAAYGQTYTAAEIQ